MLQCVNRALLFGECDPSIWLLEEAHICLITAQRVPIRGELQPEMATDDSIREGNASIIGGHIIGDTHIIRDEGDEGLSKLPLEPKTKLCGKFYPPANLCTIPGVKGYTTAILLAVAGGLAPFPNQSAFPNREGVIPRAGQSCNVEVKEPRITKAGPSVMRMTVYHEGDMGRRRDPLVATVYYRETVYHGNNQKQAMGAMMGHLGATVLTVLREGRSYELRDIEGNHISKEHTRKLIFAKYQLSEKIRRERRRRNSKATEEKTGGTSPYRRNEAAKTPQPVPVRTVSRKQVQLRVIERRNK